MSPVEKTRIDHVANLKNDIFANYDKDLIPIMKEGGGINLNLMPTVNYINMDDQGVLDLKLWLRIMWKDERLAWNPEEYGGVKQLNIPSDKIWMPDVVCFNGLSCSQDAPAKMFDSVSRQAPVILSASGDLMKVTTNLDVKVQCTDEEFANWPWGEYDAKVVFGSWTFKGAEVKLGAAEGSWYIDNTSMITNSPFVFTENSFKSDPLTIKTYGTEDEYMSLNYEFKVQRRYRLTDNGRENNPEPVPEFKPSNQ